MRPWSPVPVPYDTVQIVHCALPFRPHLTSFLFLLLALLPFLLSEPFPCQGRGGLVKGCFSATFGRFLERLDEWLLCFLHLFVTFAPGWHGFFYESRIPAGGISLERERGLVLWAFNMAACGNGACGSGHLSSSQKERESSLWMRKLFIVVFWFYVSSVVLKTRPGLFWGKVF